MSTNYLCMCYSAFFCLFRLPNCAIITSRFSRASELSVRRPRLVASTSSAAPSTNSLPPPSSASPTVSLPC
ncbi:hypothetical protein C8F04DRAFT_1116440 [Mycena alexandri]|uniref:Uncharacterized protein n=1 Tax=Mycena alexandri TaxID=1745969 RepID=A0AAD6X243_9AGAR|nr:hypothetical protein C8F04DRAFT_1116440 [Mycena alexandri]